MYLERWSKWNIMCLLYGFKNLQWKKLIHETMRYFKLSTELKLRKQNWREGGGGIQQIKNKQTNQLFLIRRENNMLPLSHCSVGRTHRIVTKGPEFNFSYLTIIFSSSMPLTYLRMHKKITNFRSLDSQSVNIKFFHLGGRRGTGRAGVRGRGEGGREREGERSLHCQDRQH